MSKDFQWAQDLHYYGRNNPLKKELPFKVNDPEVRSICQKVQATRRKLHKDLQTADTEVSKDIISLAFYQEKFVCEGSPKVFPLSFQEVYFILKQNIMVWQDKKMKSLVETVWDMSEERTLHMIHKILS